MRPARQDTYTPISSAAATTMTMSVITPTNLQFPSDHGTHRGGQEKSWPAAATLTWVLPRTTVSYTLNTSRATTDQS